MDDRTQLMGARALNPGYELLWYELQDILGQGGFGITYLAHDKNLDRSVAIKEYLPTSFAFRNQDSTVKPITTDHGENYQWGLNSFLKEAQTLARFNHHNIVRVQSVFEENNTAYMVMEYEEGESLASIYKSNAQLDQNFFENVFFPIFEGLKEIHELGFIHRDIKPANIYIRHNKTPVLIDFGSARQTSQQQTGEMTALVSQGYTPLEQYSPNYGDQGPWTDIYALAATLYQGVTGQKPAESLSRSACMLRAQPDLLTNLSSFNHPEYSQGFLDAIHAGLALQPESRPPDLYSWGSLFDSEKFATRDALDAFSSMHTEDAPIDEKTRLAPIRNRSDFDALDFESSPSSSPQYAGRDAAEPDLNIQLDDDDLKRPASGVIDSEEADSDHARSSRRSSRKSAAKKKRSKLVPIAASVLLLAGVGALGYGYLSSKNGATTFDLAELPRPANPIETTLPQQHTQAQLQELQRLGVYYSKAYKLDPNNSQVQAGIRGVFSDVSLIAEEWNASRFGNIKQSVISVVNSLPNIDNNHSRIQSILDNQSSTESTGSMLLLIENNNIVLPEGGSLLDKVSTLNTAEYNALIQEPKWVSMMNGMANSAANSIKGANFENGARIVEAALSLDPNNEQMLQLRDHLALR